MRADSTPATRRVRIIGPGKAGSAVGAALERSGWELAEPVGRSDDPSTAADGVQCCVISTPDAVIAEVAASIGPDPDTLIVHLSGSLGLDVLDGHALVGAVHPLVSITSDDANGLCLAGAWFAVGGDPAVEALVTDMGGRSVRIDDSDRARHHAAACVAANHLVTLMAQVERLAPDQVPLAAYLDLAAGALANVAKVGPAAALTGPAARGDDATIQRHLDAIGTEEHELYRAMLEATRQLALESEDTPK